MKLGRRGIGPLRRSPHVERAVIPTLRKRNGRSVQGLQLVRKLRGAVYQLSVLSLTHFLNGLQRRSRVMTFNR